MEKEKDNNEFTIYELVKEIEKGFNEQRPKPFEDEGAYAEDDE